MLNHILLLLTLLTLTLALVGCGDVVPTPAPILPTVNLKLAATPLPTQAIEVPTVLLVAPTLPPQPIIAPTNTPVPPTEVSTNTPEPTLPPTPEPTQEPPTVVPTKPPPTALPTKAALPSSGYTGPYDPFGPDRDCPDFSTHDEAQRFFEAAGGPGKDRHRLDGDHDDVACESLP